MSECTCKYSVRENRILNVVGVLIVLAGIGIGLAAIYSICTYGKLRAAPGYTTCSAEDWAEAEMKGTDACPGKPHWDGEGWESY